MNLAIICGKANTSIKTSLSNTVDNLVIEDFRSIGELEKVASQRQFGYDRILLTSSLFKSDMHNKLAMLDRFLTNHAKSTSVVLLCNKLTDEAIGSDFVNTLNTPLCVAVMVERVTPNTLKDVSLRELDFLRSSYEICQPTSATQGVEEEYFEIVSATEDEEKKGEAPKVEEKPKKRGIFDRLFHRNKNKNSEEKTEKPKTEDFSAKSNTDLGVTKINENIVTEAPNVETSVNSENVEMLEEVEIPSVNPVDSEVGEETLKEVTLDEKEELSNDSCILVDNEDLGEFSEVNNESLSDKDVNMSESDFEENETVSELADTEDLGDYCDEVEVTEGVPVEEKFSVDSTDYNSTEVDSFGSDFEGEIDNFNKEFEVVDLEHSERKQEVVEQSDVSDDIFNEIGVVDESYNEEEHYNVYDFEEEEVQVESNDNSDDLDLTFEGGVDEQYRTQATQVKIVEKTVVLNKSDVVRNILSGVTSKTILVTGDRGTGLTTTALSLAEYFADKVHVLYVDGDLKNHGSLNYLEYNHIVKFGDHQKKGVKICKSVDAFRSCRINYATNLDILVSDYNVNVSLDEFELTQSVITELADEYSVIIVDVPFDSLSACEDLILTGAPIICMDASKRGFMNTLCYLEGDYLEKRYKRALLSKGVLNLSNISKDFNFNKVKSEVNSIVDLEERGWFDLPVVEKQQKMTKEHVNKLLRG